MAVGDGRNQVVRDTMIITQWGNAIADRTVQSYANVADRNAQWPAPNDGSVAFTDDTNEYWFRYNGAWKRIPFGYLGSATNPAYVKTSGTTITTLAQYNFTAINGRVYEVVARGAGTQRAKGGSGYSRFYLSDSFGGQWYDHMNDPQVGDIMGTSGSYYTRATNSGAAWVRLSAMTSIAGGYVDFGANGTRIYVEDVGG